MWNYGLGIHIPKGGITESDWMNILFFCYILFTTKQTAMLICISFTTTLQVFNVFT